MTSNWKRGCMGRAGASATVALNRIWRTSTWNCTVRCVTLALLHLEYLEQHPEGYRYTAFCGRYNAWLKKQRLSMRQTHIAGDKMFVDYSGNKPHIVDPHTGECIEVELLVAVLGASSYTYAEATYTRQLPDWIASNSRAVAFFGGVPAAVVPDQLKSAVTVACKYDPGVQKTFDEWARHYVTTILPARPGKPKDKAKVEVAHAHLQHEPSRVVREARSIAWVGRSLFTHAVASSRGIRR